MNVEGVLFQNSRWEEITCLEEAIVAITDPLKHDFVNQNIENENRCQICDRPAEDHIVVEKAKPHASSQALVDPFDHQVGLLIKDIVDERASRDQMENRIEEEELDGDEIVYCDICYEEVAKRDLFGLTCKHIFCKDCMKDHLENNIKDGKVIKIPCMQLGCEEVFEDEDVERFGDKEVFDKYLRFKENLRVDLDPNLRWCPRPDCEFYVEKKPKSKTTKCKCGTNVCMACGAEAKEMHKCGQSDEERVFEIWKKGEGGKHCPNCQIVIIKNGGCNHMTCVKCKHEFCWYDFQNYRVPGIDHFESTRPLPCPA